MERSIFDHVDLRVRSLAESAPFYDVAMPALGLHHKREIGEHILYYRKIGRVPAECIVLFEDTQHVPTGTVLAFYAPTYAEVDATAAKLCAAGARNVEGPLRCPEYSETYYAFFFTDPSGNRLEVVCRRPSET
ncbi:MAG: VOC family protein [Vulcanimicrobiaceae bacterium]